MPLLKREPRAKPKPPDVAVGEPAVPPPQNGAPSPPEAPPAEPTAEELQEATRRLDELQARIDQLGDSMPTDDFTPEERALIQERRAIKARAEAARIEAEQVPDILALSTAEILKLSPEAAGRALKANLERALKGD